ncbi:MAG: hypothetical protein R3B13_03445 [Polyangiaceae bacterium]
MPRTKTPGAAKKKASKAGATRAPTKKASTGKTPPVAAKKATSAKATSAQAKTSTAKAPRAPAKMSMAKAPRVAHGPMSARMKEIMRKHDDIYGKGYFTPTKVKCPLCGKGVIVPKRGRFGAEWRCNADVRPMCSFKLETKPTGKKCTYKRGGKPCGALMVAGTKTIPDRCSDKTCPNRNPHKL